MSIESLLSYHKAYNSIWPKLNPALRYAMPCHAMLYHAVPCRALPAVLCRAVLCYVLQLANELLYMMPSDVIL